MLCDLSLFIEKINCWCIMFRGERASVKSSCDGVCGIEQGINGRRRFVTLCFSLRSLFSFDVTGSLRGCCHGLSLKFYWQAGLLQEDWGHELLGASLVERWVPRNRTAVFPDKQTLGSNGCEVWVSVYPRHVRSPRIRTNPVSCSGRWVFLPEPQGSLPQV